MAEMFLQTDFFSSISSASGYSNLHNCAQSAFYSALSVANYDNCQVSAAAPLYCDCLCTNNANPLSTAISAGVSSYGCSESRESSTEVASALSVFGGFCSSAAKAIATVPGYTPAGGAAATASPGSSAVVASSTGGASQSSQPSSNSNNNVGLIGLVGLLGLLAIPLTFGLLWYAKRTNRWGFHPRHEGAIGAEKRVQPAQSTNATANGAPGYGRHELDVP